VLQEDVDTFTPLYATWKSQAHAAGVSEEHPNGLDGTFTVPSPTMPDPTILKTGEVLLEWVDDLFV